MLDTCLLAGANGRGMRKALSGWSKVPAITILVTEFSSRIIYIVYKPYGK